MFIKAIDTEYRGFRFRSRLEARWAVFLDAVGRRWDYEREGFELPSGRYLPDFWLPIESDRHPHAGYWLEIKPFAPTDRESRLACELTEATRHRTLVVAGPPREGQFEVWKTVGKYGSVRLARTWPSQPIAVPPELRPFLPSVLDADETGHGLYGLYYLLNATPSFDRFVFDPVGVTPALKAARSARFEFGETPR